MAADRDQHVDDTVDAGLDRTTVDRAAPTDRDSDSAPGGVPAHIAPGASLRQYELIRELGHGGMGRVFLARDTKLGRRVAIKVLSRTSSTVAGRFLLEARTTARLNHENIIVIHEVDEHAGVPYMVLEYLEGSSLRELIRRGAVPPSRAVEIIVPVLRALVRAHGAGVMHRDLKPENIFVTTSGTIKVLDFGIAKLLSQAERPAGDDGGQRPSDLSLTGGGALVGTVPYMAPEQLLCEPVDHRADLWAVGIVLWEMCAGEHPLAPVSGATVVASACQPDVPMPAAARIPGLPPALEAAIDACLRKRPEQRVGSAADLLGMLEPLAMTRAVRARSGEDNPYPGLVAFQETDADRFFGRAREAARVASRLREQPLLAIVGPSGVGKSSLIRAGVVPLLRASESSWDVLALRPGRHPMSALAHLATTLSASGQRPVDALADAQALEARIRVEPGHLAALLRAQALFRRTSMLIFVDQFEELYTLVADPAERLAFTRALTAIADDAESPLRVVVSMRSDLLDRVGEDRELLAELTRGLIFLQPLGRDALREALTQPLEAVDYRFESDDLVVEMIAALDSAPGALPLLQFTCRRLWETRDRGRRMLTRASYDELGGVAGALSTHADEVLAGLPVAAQRIIRLMFQRLVTPERTRALADVDELLALPAPRDEIQAALDVLAQARLVVVQTRADEHNASVEIAHESLIERWPTLRRWLDEAQDDAAYLQQLRTAARQWAARGRAQGVLWRGDDALEARAWRARYRGELTAGEQDFLRAVFALADRAQRVRLAVAGGLVALLLVVVIVGAIALVSVRNAERDTRAQMVRAQQEADRARDAERRVQEQLDLLRSEQAARQSAQADATRAQGTVEQREAELERANAELTAALTRAEAAQTLAEQQGRRAAEESGRARTAADQSRQKSEALEKANARLQELLQRERERAERLERERRKITTELPQ